MSRPVFAQTKLDLVKVSSHTSLSARLREQPAVLVKQETKIGGGYVGETLVFKRNEGQ